MPRRWLIALMLMLLSVLNYVDRQALAILATTIQEKLGLTNVEYGRVVQAFLFCYAVSYLAAGRVVDRVGPRIAETAFVAWWSVANMLTGLAGGFASLAACRGLLAVGEAGHYSVAAKAVGRWFPPAERGLAVSLYTMGGTLGAALAAPLVAWLTIDYGWRAAFVVTGAAGLGFALAWWLVYRDPPTLSPAAAAPPAKLRDVLAWKPLWLIAGVRMLTDPVWYFYLVWFAKYLQEQRQYSLKEVGTTLWVVFVAADVGCLLAGGVAGLLIRRGVPPLRARLGVMAACAVVLAFNFTVPLAETGGGAIARAALMAGCVLCFMTCAVALPLDLVPAASLGTAQGVIGTGSSVGGMISTGLVAWVVTDYSYHAAFIGFSVVHPVAVVFLIALLPRLGRVNSP